MLAATACASKPVVGQRLDGLLELLGPARGHGQAVALLAEHPRDRQPDPAGSSGHECGTACHRVSSSVVDSGVGGGHPTGLSGWSVSVRLSAMAPALLPQRAARTAVRACALPLLAARRLRRRRRRRRHRTSGGRSRRSPSDRVPAARGPRRSPSCARDSGPGPVLAPTVSSSSRATNRFGFGLFDRARKQISDAPAAVYVAPRRAARPHGPVLRERRVAERRAAVPVADRQERPGCRALDLRRRRRRSEGRATTR